MSDKNDLDMQTFQIYQEEDSLEVVENSEPIPKKKFGFNLKKDTNKESSDSDTNKESSDSDTNKKDIIKGIAIGLLVLMVLIVVDQLNLI